MMSFQDEEESPCIHHRSLFDTIPAPPSFAARKPSEPTLMSARGDFTGKGDDGEPVRVSANGRAAFAFPGGVVEVRKPTREDLLASVIDWSHLAKGYADEIYTEALRGNAYKEPIMALRSAVDHLDAVLKELADHG